MSRPIKLSSPATREFWEIPVLFEDEHLLALDKPPLLLTSQDRSDPQRPSLMSLVHHDLGRDAPWAKGRDLSYLMSAHRLDFETSGVLLCAKSKPVLVALANLFGSGQINVTCLALVQGVPTEDTFVVEAKLAPMTGADVAPAAQNAAAKGPPFPTDLPARHLPLMRVNERRGKRSKTAFKVCERFSGYTLLECRPFTHRPSQISVHLRHVGFPILGDAAYGGSLLLLSQLKSGYRLKPKKIERPLISHRALHAEQFSFMHPVTGAEINIMAPLPKDMAVALKYLRRLKSEQAV